MTDQVLRVALATPLRRAFDYWAPGGAPPGAGTRVSVPFGRGTQIGLVLGVAGSPGVAPERVKEVLEVLDPEPLLPPRLVGLLEWVARYYHHPVGEVVFGALPSPLRRGAAARVHGPRVWTLTASGQTADPLSLARAPRQAQALELLRARGEPLPDDPDPTLQRALRALAARGWVEPVERPCLSVAAAPALPAPPLSPAQEAAVAAVVGHLGRFQPVLVEGVTGSGKTEVYLRLIQEVVARGRQALVLVPEIALGPQMVSRLSRRLEFPVAVLHSGLGDGERLCAWLSARAGLVPVVIGTRSALFVPLPRLGLVVVDEEHDASYKQQEGLRYSARDMAVARARHEGIPVVLGSATPSLETVYNARRGRYLHVHLPERVGGGRQPRVGLVDLRRTPLRHGLSPPLLAAVAATIGRREQVLLFLNRRGYAPALICHACGWVANCLRCDAHLIFHRAAGLLRCHHCGAERPGVERCPACAAPDLRPVGSGTERLEDAIRDAFPEARIERIDRDTTRRKGSLEGVLERVSRGEAEILVGTQMLAKGHHFPRVTLAAVVDADGGLFSTDFRAPERMAQLITQVAGRAGRGDLPGEVLIQTHHPAHPFLRTLLQRGYAHFAQAALAEREAAGLPPLAYQALLRADSHRAGEALGFLRHARAAAAEPGVQLLGPVAAPMERRAGRYRAQLLLQARRRAPLHRLLDRWLPVIEGLPLVRQVRWSLDVDPVDFD